MKEVWKDIAGYEKLYQVSNFGRIKRKHFSFIDSIGRKQSSKECIKKLQVSNCGYCRVQLFDINHIAKRFNVHRLVAWSFIPNPYNKPEVNHKNGVKADNRVENLEWATSSENQKHAFKNGLQKIRRGTEIAWSKLTDDDIRTIRDMYSSGNISQQKLASDFGVSQSQINRIINKKEWSHIN